jgi:hypothetical protein
VEQQNDIATLDKMIEDGYWYLMLN